MMMLKTFSNIVVIILDITLYMVVHQKIGPIFFDSLSCRGCKYQNDQGAINDLKHSFFLKESQDNNYEVFFHYTPSRHEQLLMPCSVSVRRFIRKLHSSCVS